MTRPRRQHLSFRRFLLPAALAAAVLLPTGCAAPVVVMTAGITAAQTGATTYINGELESAQVARMEVVFRAVKHTMEDLKFPVTMEHIGPHTAYVFSKETTGRPIKVFLAEKSAMTTKTNIRVGFWGDQAMARMLIAEIQARCPAIPAAEPVSDMAERL